MRKELGDQLLNPEVNIVDSLKEITGGKGRFHKVVRITSEEERGYIFPWIDGLLKPAVLPGGSIEVVVPDNSQLKFRNIEGKLVDASVKTETVLDLKEGDNMPGDDRMVHVHEDIEAYFGSIPCKWKEAKE